MNFSEMEIMIFPGPRERRVAELLAMEGMCAAGSVTGGGVGVGGESGGW